MKLDDDYPMPQYITDTVHLLRTQPEIRLITRARLDAQLAVLVASELNRATRHIGANLTGLLERVGGLTNALTEAGAGAREQVGNLTDAVTRSATALNRTSEAGNDLNRRIRTLTGITVVLAVVQTVVVLVPLLKLMGVIPAG